MRKAHKSIFKQNDLFHVKHQKNQRALAIFFLLHKEQHCRKTTNNSYRKRLCANRMTYGYKYIDTINIAKFAVICRRICNKFTAPTVKYILTLITTTYISKLRNNPLCI